LKLLLCALLGEQRLDDAFELEQRRLRRLIEPASQRVSAMLSDGVHRARAPAGVLAGGGGEALGDELLGLFVDLALRARPVVAGAAFQLLCELVGGPVAKREMAEDEV